MLSGSISGPTEGNHSEPVLGQHHLELENTQQMVLGIMHRSFRKTQNQDPNCDTKYIREEKEEKCTQNTYPWTNLQ